MPCNLNNPKARDNNYECNPLTNRWVKKKVVIKQKTAGNCNPKNPKALDINYECNPITNRWIKKKLTHKTKENTTEKTKRWHNKCKEMEQKCPMETDLSGDSWCSLEPKDVFYYVKNGRRFCYGVNEIFSIIHLGFTARDTSYEVPPLRLQLPRDSYDRSPFTKDFFVEFTKHIKKHKQLPIEPEVCYFLKYFREFYNDRKIRPFLNQTNPPKVQLSNTIDHFLLKHKDVDINLNTSKWFWLPNKNPRNIFKYLFP